MKLFSFWRSLATFRVRAALNYKGLIPDDVIEIDLLKGDQREANFRAINPMMAIPALIDGDGPALFESLAIMEYLDEVHPQPPLLPTDPSARARVRGLAQIVACDSHPLTVPRVRNYLEHEFKFDEETRAKWCGHWVRTALEGLEQHLSAGHGTGTYCQGEQITLADICLVGQSIGAHYFKVEMAAFPTVSRIVAATMRNDAIARAHPLRQPGAPKSV